jgi:hypothetical protein
MGWFDPPGLKLHRRICNQYEQIAFGDYAHNPDADSTFPVLSLFTEAEESQ